jgi:hypothetical protein
VYYLSYPCKTDERLQGWDVVYKVSLHGRLPVPNNEDYSIYPNTYEGEFFQEDGPPGDFVIDLTEAFEIMEVEDDVEKRLTMTRTYYYLRELQPGNMKTLLRRRNIWRTCVIVMMRLMILIISMKMFITNTCRLHTYCIIICNIMLFLILSYFSFAIS